MNIMRLNYDPVDLRIQSAVASDIGDESKGMRQSECMASRDKLAWGGRGERVTTREVVEWRGEKYNTTSQKRRG
jgi:hypothetical protein